MAIQYSIQKMVSDGTLSTIALGIQYLQRNDIYIRIAGEETPQSGAPSGYTWSFLDNTTLKILPVVPNGVGVVVYRRTDIDTMYNIYSQNAQFDEATIDENNRQLLYTAQEYLEQGIPGAGVASLEYVSSNGGINYYRFQLTDGAYTPVFGVPDGTDVLRTDLAAPSGAHLVGGIQVRRMTVADAKTGNFQEGEVCYITDRGYNFRYSNSRELVVGHPSSTMTYDDELHILVLAGGMLQFCDWDYVYEKATANIATFAGVVKSNSLPINIDVYGDSIAFGQAMPSTTGATDRNGHPTGFGDGSVYANWQYNANYPIYIASFLQDNLPNPVTVANRGFSGDTALLGYLRHRVTTGASCAVIGYGINDVNVATSNGYAPQNILSAQYSISGYTSMLRLFAAKQILLGKRVVILGTSFYAGLSGYDGTQFSSPRIARAYNEAAKAVADEFGCMYIDVCQDIFNQYSIPAITQEATHLNETGLRIMGVRIASAVASVATINRVSHGSVLAANPQINTVLTKLSGNILPNSTSVTARGAITDEPTTMLAGDSWITIPFYAESGGLVAYINGVAPVGGVDTEIRIDDGATQADYLHQYSFFGGKPASAKAFAVAGRFGRETENISDVASMLLVVANRGWHSISIKRRSGLETLLFDSIYFESLPSVIASDMLGVTAKASRFQSGFDSSHSVNIQSISSPSVGRVDIVFKNPMSHDRYTVVVDFSTQNTLTNYRVEKTLTGISVYFLSAIGSGTGVDFQPSTPETMTATILGGR